MEAMKQLIYAIEGGSCPLRLLDSAGFGKGNVHQGVMIRAAFNGDMSAAMEVKRCLLDEFGIEISQSKGMVSALVFKDGWRDNYTKNTVNMSGDNIARAVLLAVLRAKLDVDKLRANMR